LRINTLNIAIGGGSAGGHLAAILAQRCLAKKIPLKLQILSVPATDLTALDDNWNIRADCPYDSYLENALAPGLPLERIQFFLKFFLGEKMPNPLPTANPAILSPEVELSPMKTENVSGLAPAMISTADVDILRDEGEAYAKKLSAQGVPVKLKRYMGVSHPFMFMDGVLQEARDYIRDCCDELTKAFNK
jgi:acetyl esterase/lipase